MGNLQVEKQEQSEELKYKNNLKNGSNGKDVKVFQQHLKQLAYYIGKIDGIFGSLTDNATRDFQVDYNLKVDGIIGSVTQKKIKEISSSSLTFESGSRDNEIKTLQRQLNRLKMYNGNIDGIFGQLTDSGVKSFQKNNQLTEDGKVGINTKKKIKEKLLGEDLNIDKGGNGDTPFEVIGDTVNDILGLEDEKNKREIEENEVSGVESPVNVSLKKDTGSIYVSAEQLKEIGWVNINEIMLRDLNNCLERYDITKTQRIRHFISQCSVESGAGKYTMEQSWDRNKIAGAAYEGREDLGNIHPGDGPKYKGAGYIQLTGRRNYQQFADNIKDPKVMDGAEYVAKKYPWTSAGFYWDREKINTLCDRGATVKEITKKVNGGYNGLAEREKYYRKCSEVFK